MAAEMRYITITYFYELNQKDTRWMEEDSIDYGHIHGNVFDET